MIDASSRPLMSAASASAVVGTVLISPLNSSCASTSPAKRRRPLDHARYSWLAPTSATLNASSAGVPDITRVM